MPNFNRKHCRDFKCLTLTNCCWFKYLFLIERNSTGMGSNAQVLLKAITIINKIAHHWIQLPAYLWCNRYETNIYKLSKLIQLSKCLITIIDTQEMNRYETKWKMLHVPSAINSNYWLWLTKDDWRKIKLYKWLI